MTVERCSSYLSYILEPPAAEAQEAEEKPAEEAG